MKYIKLFDTHADYAAYIGGSDKVLPNVSYCENENEVHYNPWVETRLIANYTVEDDSNPTTLYAYYTEEGDEEYWVRGIDLFDKIEIDGVEVSISDLDTAQGQYQLSEGEHTARYTLKDPTTIGYSAFDTCNSITSVTIPNSVTSIGNYVFSACSGLTNVVIPNSVTSIGDGVFYGCSGLTSVTISNSVTTISQSTFTGCTSLTSVTIPNSVTSIGEGALGECTSLTSIIIPNSVTTIGQDAFYECSALTSITIGNSVTTIGQGTFANCSGLTSVTVQATTPPTLGNSNAFNSTNNCPIYVPSASVAAYKAATNWSSLSSRIQAIP